MDCIFCEFVKKKKVYHKKGYPFFINHETKNTISFLSLDSPVNDDAHLIIIPKGHYKDFHQIPDNIKAELINHVALAGRFYSSKNRGYNILLNNSRVAGQFVPHSHFHVIPRKRGDMIKIEVWERKRISSDAFKKLSVETAAAFKKHVQKGQ